MKLEVVVLCYGVSRQQHVELWCSLHARPLLNTVVTCSCVCTDKNFIKMVHTVTPVHNRHNHNRMQLFISIVSTVHMHLVNLE